MELYNNDYANYQVILQTVEGRKILRAGPAKSGSAKIGRSPRCRSMPETSPRAITSSSFSARPQTVEVKRSTDTSSECRKKKYPYQKNCDIFWLFFGVVGGSTNATGLILISRA